MKTVYDTCLYIDLLRSRERIDLFCERSHIRYLSPVVLMELRAGARTPGQRRAVDRLFSPYSKANRIIHLGANLYYKAGECLVKLDRKAISAGFCNDLLIAISALSIGATLYTNDKKDFSLIGSVVPVEIAYV